MRAILFRTVLIVAAVVLLVAIDSRAQDHTHAKAVHERLGTVHFATSCDAAAQIEFDRAVALLHSFEFSRAIGGFNSVSKTTTPVLSLTGVSLSANGAIHSPSASKTSLSC